MALKEIIVPDIGNFSNVAIAEVYISEGDTVEIESSVVSLESDKAVMDIPSPFAGKIVEVRVKAGGTVSAGDVLAVVETEEEEVKAAEEETGKGLSREKEATADRKDETGPAGVAGKQVEKEKPAETPLSGAEGKDSGEEPEKGEADSGKGRDDSGKDFPVHASPSVRILARKLGVDLSAVDATGPKGRVLKEDLYRAVSEALGKEGSVSHRDHDGDAAAGRGGGAGLPEILKQAGIDEYLKAGPAEEVRLSRIRKISGKRVHQHWIGIPQVTHFEEADVTGLEEFRAKINSENRDGSFPKLTVLPFVVIALVDALKKYPDFNSSLAPDGEKLIRKKYYNFGIAVDTPEGLLVPVLKDADRKSIAEIASELVSISARAREGKLDFSDMQGSTFSISSLGGIGGTGFTPIVNHPEAGILGLSRISIRPVWNGEKFEPKKILPFSVSYDHRIIDGAKCAYFAKYLSDVLSDSRRLLLGRVG